MMSRKEPRMYIKGPRMSKKDLEVVLGAKLSKKLDGRGHQSSRIEKSLQCPGKGLGCLKRSPYYLQRSLQCLEEPSTSGREPRMSGRDLEVMLVAKLSEDLDSRGHAQHHNGHLRTWHI